MKHVDCYIICKYPEFILYEVDNEWWIYIPEKENFIKFNSLTGEILGGKQ